jgi:hypothetical protein
VERITIGKHKQEWRELPGRIAGCFSEKGKASPEKNQYREGNYDFFGGYQTHEIPGAEKKQIEKNVARLARDGKSGDLLMFDQLCEPGVVNVAAEVASLDT